MRRWLGWAVARYRNLLRDSVTKKTKRKKTVISVSKKSRRQASDETTGQDIRADRMEFEGIIEECMPGTLFQVICNDNGMRVLATLSGKLRMNHIRLLPGDKVTVEVSPYDTSRGRVTWRHI